MTHLTGWGSYGRCGEVAAAAQQVCLQWSLLFLFRLQLGLGVRLGFFISSDP